MYLSHTDLIPRLGFDISDPEEARIAAAMQAGAIYSAEPIPTDERQRIARLLCRHGRKRFDRDWQRQVIDLGSLDRMNEARLMLTGDERYLLSDEFAGAAEYLAVVGRVVAFFVIDVPKPEGLYRSSTHMISHREIIA